MNTIQVTKELFDFLMTSNRKDFRNEMAEKAVKGQTTFSLTDLTVFEEKQPQRIRVNLPQEYSADKYKVCPSCYKEAKAAEGCSDEDAVQLAVKPIEAFGKVRDVPQSYCRKCINGRTKKYKASKITEEQRKAQIERLQQKLQALQGNQPLTMAAAA